MTESDFPHLPPSLKMGRTQRNIVVMGVAGCGKSTIGLMLAGRLGYVYAEGDEFHTQANRDKMHAGHPLNDDDRAPWLQSIADWMTAEAEAGRSTVVSCSALKRKYRDVLRSAKGRTVFVHIAPPEDLNRARLEARTGHFMNPALLDSQYATLEELEPDEEGVTITNPGTPEEVFVEAMERLAEIEW